MASRGVAITPGAAGNPARAHYDARLLDRIRGVHSAHDGNYGSPRVHGALRHAGVRVGAKRVARLMRVHCLRGKVADLYRSRAGTKAFSPVFPIANSPYWPMRPTAFGLATSPT